MKRIIWVLVGIGAFAVIMTAVYELGSKNNSDKSDTFIKAKSSQSLKKESLVDTFQAFSKKGKSTDEMYVTGNIKVGSDSELKPGIYDLQVTGGSGNIGADRDQTSAPFINYLGDDKGNLNSQGTGDVHGPSKIRLILFSGDVLKLDNISKVKFIAISKFQSSNELGQGEYIVGLDIPAGTYKLSSNVKFNPEFDNLGWSIDILDKNGDNKTQEYNSSNNDVVVKLNNGDVVSTSNMYSGETAGITPDQEKLIFNKVK